MTDSTGGMGARAGETRKKVDNAMKTIEEKVLQAASVNLENLRPQISDKESFEQLLRVINDATRQNDDIATLKERIFTLGEGVVNVAVKVASLIA
jgi:hypothetical protein